MMMNLKQVSLSAKALYSQIKGGISLSETVLTMAVVQPAFQEFWTDTYRSIENGNPLSVSLRSVWPDTIVDAVVAGEESGKLESVLGSIVDAVAIQLQLRKTMRRLIYPVGIFCVGILMFVAILVFIAPTTVRSLLGSKVPDNFLISMSFWMESFMFSYWMYVVGGLAMGIALVVQWMQSAEGKVAVLEFGMRLPVIGPGLELMYFGLWCKYMSLMCASGIDFVRSILLTLNVVPPMLQDGFVLLERDLVVMSKSIYASVDIKQMSEDDPRRNWPLFVRNAMTVGAKTGDHEVEFLRVAPQLIADGIDKLEAAISIGEVAATIFAGAIVGGSFLAIYVPLFTSMRLVR